MYGIAHKLPPHSGLEQLWGCFMKLKLCKKFKLKLQVYNLMLKFLTDSFMVQSNAATLDNSWFVRFPKRLLVGSC